jgi:DNA-binding IclR family transcriptional regulator
MACISPDGKPSVSGAKMLRALKAKAGSAEEVSQSASLPLFRVRSGLRELAQAGLVSQKGEQYEYQPKAGSWPTVCPPEFI